MLKELFFIPFVISSIIYITHFGLNIVGANFYDIWQFRRKRGLPKSHHSVRPLVSVLIPAHNEELSIIRCLDSVRRNTYRKLEIIVIDDASTDNTRKLVRDYIKQHPKRDIKLMYRQKNHGKAAALNHALHSGDLIMTLDADSVLERHAISNMVTYFEDPKVVGVAANVQIMDNFTVLGLLQRFEHMVGYRAKKFYSMANCEFIVGGVASTYRRQTLQAVKYYDLDTTTEDIGLSLKVVAQGNKDQRIIYGADVLAQTEGVQTFKALLRQRYRWKLGSLQNLLKNRHLFANPNKRYSRALTFYRIPMAYLGEILLMLEPFMFAYIVYLSLLYATTGLFIGAYMTITLYILWNLWPDEHTNVRRKLTLSMFAPFMYFAFYIMSLVQIVSIFRVLFNAKQLVKRGEHEGRWVSPERQGNAVQFS